MNTIYTLLNNDAKNWWYHKQLRAQNDIKKARQLERESIKNAVRHLRTALYCDVGYGGHCIILKGHGSVTGYQDINGNDVQACIRYGVPTIDKTTIKKDVLCNLAVSMPLIAEDHECDQPPYGSLSYAPMLEVFSIYKLYGATIYNVKNLPKPNPELFKTNAAHNRLLHAYCTNDVCGVGEALSSMK